MLKVTQAVREQWKLKEHFSKRARDGSDQPKGAALEDDEQFAERMRNKILNEQQKVEGKKAIAKRHITEFANDQYTNFATILGLPEISLEDLVGKKDQREPIINDAIREKTFFAKQTEGYPSYFSERKLGGAALGLHTENIGICDFYESLAITPKVNAALYQAFESIKGAMTPENGFAASCLELCLIREARAEIKKLQIVFESDYQVCDLPGQNLIEEDFYLANSDKLIFAMKEFKADMEPSQMYTRANPVVMSKLDVQVSKPISFHVVNLERTKLQLPAYQADRGYRLLRREQRALTNARYRASERADCVSHDRDGKGIGCQGDKGRCRAVRRRGRVGGRGRARGEDRCQVSIHDENGL